MKKLLAILVLSLSLAGCATHENIVSSTTFYKGMSKNKIKDIFYWGEANADPFLSCFKEYYQEQQTEIIAGKSKKLYFVFENVTKPRVTCKYGDRGNGTLLLWTSNYSEAKDAATKARKINKVTAKKTTKTQKVKASSGSAFFASNRGGMNVFISLSDKKVEHVDMFGIYGDDLMLFEDEEYRLTSCDTEHE